MMPRDKAVFARGRQFMTGSPMVAKVPVQTSARHRGASIRVQASLAGRLGRVVRSYLFFYGDSAVADLEDPRKLLDQAVADMQADMVKMRSASAQNAPTFRDRNGALNLQVQVAQRQMEERYRSAQTAADDWQRRAEWALRKGDEDLAREALKRRKTFEARPCIADSLLADQHS
ncbi:probable membrane-associated 30 kDa protein, chloroplastic [Coccomyxa sp. Obi]|nr:probable membrane-associated 30 kDa protein, chloroplastic [Coccomyxa sp. Obi]